VLLHDFAQRLGVEGVLEEELGLSSRLGLSLMSFSQAG